MPRSDWVLECYASLVRERSAAPLADRPNCSCRRSAAWAGVGGCRDRTDVANTWRSFVPGKATGVHTSTSRSVLASLGRTAKYPPIGAAHEREFGAAAAAHKQVLCIAG